MWKVKDVDFVSAADKQGVMALEDKDAASKSTVFANFDQERFMDDFLIFHF